MLVQGTTIFNTSLTQFDTYQGQSTDKYSLQITLDKFNTDLQLEKVRTKAKAKNIFFLIMLLLKRLDYQFKSFS